MGNKHKTGPGSRKALVWMDSVGTLKGELSLLSLILYYACAPNELADGLIVGNWSLLQDNLEGRSRRDASSRSSIKRI
jgi:hypothetical protein